MPYVYCTRPNAIEQRLRPQCVLRVRRCLVSRSVPRHLLRRLGASVPAACDRPPRARIPVELPVLALRDTVVFPLTLQPLAITRPMSIESVNRALASDRLLFLALQTTDDEEPQPDDLKKIGTIAAIRQMAKVPNGGIHVIVEGLARARADVMTLSGQVLRATVKPAPEQTERTIEVDAYVRRMHELIDRALSVRSGLSQELRGAGGRHRRSAAARVPAVEPARHEGRGEAADPRARRASSPKLQAVATALEPRDRAARAQGQDRDRPRSRR